MGERRGTKGLELWCRRMVEDYPGVKIENMTTSWRDGLAFCAMIHHFRPDLIDFSKLKKNDIYHNNELAFRIAEHHLGIPALLEPEDMVEFPVPDRLSILTYLSQFYQTFAISQGASQTRIAPKRPQTSSDHNIASPTSTSPPTKLAFVGAGKIRREPCAKCGLPVFIAERLNVGKLLFHRTCFRCARCTSQLTFENYYETENGDFCCETCPDEEKQQSPSQKLDVQQSVVLRSMSDEEKSANLKPKIEEPDEYSTKFETALEFLQDNNLKRNSTLITEQNQEFLLARSKFLNSQIVDIAKANSSDSGNEEEDEPPDLPLTKKTTYGIKGEFTYSLDTESAHCDSGFPSNINRLEKSVNIEYSGKNSGINNQYETSSQELEKTQVVVTKDKAADKCNHGNISMVKTRMQLFETNKILSPKKNDAQTFLLAEVDKECKKQQQNEDEDIVLNSNSIITIEDTSNEADNSKSSDNLISEGSVIVIDDISTNADSTTSEDRQEHQTDSKEVLIISTASEEEQENQIIDSGTKFESNKLHEEKINNISEIKPITEYNLNQKAKTIQSHSTPQMEDYPDDLNPFGIDEEKDSTPPNINVSEATNPFGDDNNEVNENSVKNNPVPSPRSKKKIIPTWLDRNIKGTPECLSHIYIERISVNPFESDDEEDNTDVNIVKPPLPLNRKKKILKAPKISLNPFWSSGDENDDNASDKKPIPTPRVSKASMGVNTTIAPMQGSTNAFGSNSSLSSTRTSPGGTMRKKKPAPKPPVVSLFKDDASESTPKSLSSSPCHSLEQSPRSTQKPRKFRKAPLPPGFSSSPLNPEEPTRNLTLPISPINLTESSVPSNETTEFETEKIIKDEANRNRQILNITSPTSSENSLSVPNKSSYGKWKRRKGQAPSRPIPLRRTIKLLPTEEVRRELDMIEIQLQGLEKQGVRLEHIIRERCEGNDVENKPNNSNDDSLPADAEDLILQLFELVNEKNELFRKQTELMYFKRQQRLEEEHADVEYQIRCLMLQPEANKTDSDKAREEELINRLVEIVERRNEIIECLEMDRVREAEEDDSINNHLNLYSLKKDDVKTDSDKVNKDKKKHKKDKRFKFKTSRKVDADKDIDETEVIDEIVEKKKKKKKLNLF